MKPALELPTVITIELQSSLIHSVELGIPELFIDTVSWAQSMLVFRDRSPWELTNAIEAMTFKLHDYVRASDEASARETLRRAKEELAVVRLLEKSYIDESTENGAIARRYLDALLDGNEARASREALLAVANGQKTLDVYQHILAPVLQETGRLWQRNEITVAHEHAVTYATERVMAQLMDMVPARAHRDLCATVAALGTAEHAVGARMVADAFALCGWHVTFLGGEVPVGDIVRYAETNSIDVIAASATLARDVPAVRDLIESFESQPVAPVVIVGGRAFDTHPGLWKSLGADGYSPTPLMSVALASELISDCEAH